MPQPRKGSEAREPTAAQLRNGIAHQLRSAMAHGLRVSVNAGRRSCIGVVVRMPMDETMKQMAEADSNLTAHIDTGHKVVEVPVGQIVGVSRA